MAESQPQKQDEVVGPCGHYGVIGKAIKKVGGAYIGSFDCGTCGPYERDVPTDAIPPIIKELIDMRGQLTESDFKYLGIFKSLALGL